MSRWLNSHFQIDSLIALSFALTRCYPAASVMMVYTADIVDELIRKLCNNYYFTAMKQFEFWRNRLFETSDCQSDLKQITKSIGD